MTAASGDPLPTRSRTVARVAAIQALYQCEQNGDRADDVIVQFGCHRLTNDGAGSFEDGHAPEADRKLFELIVKGVHAQEGEIRGLLTGALPSTWPVERLDPVLRNLLNAGIFEIRDGVPLRVVINEYLDVAHGFFSGDEAKLVHGVLDAIGRAKGREESRPAEGSAPSAP